MSAPSRAGLDEELAAVCQHVRAAWPTVTIPEATFIAHLARHLPEHAPAGEGLSRLRVADLYLASACATGDEQAVAAFEAYCMQGLDRALGRLRLSRDEIAEVKQRIRYRVLVADGRPRILEFSGRGALPSWVRAMAVREAFRVVKRPRETALDDSERLLAYVVRDDRDRANAHYRQVFAQAFDRALRQLEPRVQTMLRQHVIDGLTIDQLSALYRVHRATAARTLERARRTILAATRAQMRAALDVGSTELSSILRSIRSRLEVSLRGLRRRVR
jgi:RNA polymerase sigma-70 factor (ECF subfamily)